MVTGSVASSKCGPPPSAEPRRRQERSGSIVQHLHVEVGALGGDNKQQTKSTSREVNPIWNSTMTLVDLQESDRLHVVLKDTGMFRESYLGGAIGPRVLASTSLGVGDDFEGFLELTPEAAIPNNGRPVLQVSVRFKRLQVGQNMVGQLRDFFDAPPEIDSPGVSMDSQAMQLHASAPPMSMMQDAQQSLVEESQQVPLVEESLVQESLVQDAKQKSLVEESTPVPPDIKFHDERSTSPFFIDREAKNFAELPLLIESLCMLQERNITFPFPSSPCRNYNVLACGFDWEPPPPLACS